MPDTRPDVAVQGGALSDRGFWAVFAGAWLAYFALYVTAASRAEGVTLVWAGAMALVQALPPAALSVVVALRRRDLLEPERTLARTVLMHALVGMLFAVTSGAIVRVSVSAIDWPESLMPKGEHAEPFLLHVVSGLVLYAILAGFLMWAESLRRVHESRSVAAREAMLRAQAEAKALRAQFNPHFVFNTLHSLMLLVRADPAAAEQAIEDVATLIRYASVLQREDVDLVPLAKELEVARRYLALEELRLEDRLQVAWSVEVDPDSVTVPPFVLQTLLENAIKHGLEPKPAGGTVAIRAAVEDGMLGITVSDDGQGADPESVERAANHGLHILSKRLVSLYGDSGSVRWRTQTGQGFTGTARFPARAPAPPPAHDGRPSLGHLPGSPGGAT